MKSLLLYIVLAFGLILSCTPKTGQKVSDYDLELKKKLEPQKVESVDEVVLHAIELPSLENDESVKIGKLQNGLQYYIQKNAKPENRAELRLVVKAGSLHEDADQLGLAHFIEHMAFNGSKNFDKNELVNYLESVGSKFGPDLNAYTSFDETVYMLQVRTDDEEQFAKGLLVLSDWSYGLTFDPEEIDKERGVVISEWRSRLSAQQRMLNKTLPILFKGSRYANRLPIGDPDIIKNASYETIKRFYYKWYRPDLMAVMITGDIDVNLVEDQVVTLFDQVPKALGSTGKRKYDVPYHDETLIKVNSDPEAPFTEVQLIHKHDAKIAKTTWDYRERLVKDLYSSMLNARLSEKTKSDDPPFLFGINNWGRYIGPTYAYYGFARALDGGSMKALKVLLEENERAKRHGFQETEMARAKAALKAKAETELKEVGKTDSRKLIQKNINHFLHDEIILSVADKYKLIEQFLDGIKLAEINQVAEDLARDENRVIVINAPEKEGVKLPTEMEIRKLLGEVEKSKIEPYKDWTNDAPLFEGELVPINVKGKKDEVSQVTTYDLPNGASVHIKTTDFNNDQIVFHALAKGGVSMFDKSDYLAAQLSPAIVEQSGLGNFTNVELQKKLTGKTLKLRSYVGGYYHGSRGQCAPKDLETLLQMVYLGFYPPRQDLSAFKSVIKKQADLYSNVLSDPRYYFINETNKVLSGNDPRKTFPTTENINLISQQKALDDYVKCFSDASNFDFFLVGNIDDAALKMILDYIGNLPTSNRKLTNKSMGVSFPESNRLEWEMGEAPKTFVQISYHIDKDYDPDFAFKFSRLKDVLNIKLREELREDKGGVYGVRLYSSVSRLPENDVILNISFNADPPVADELIDAALKVVESQIVDGPLQSDIDKVKEIKRQELTKGLNENDFWLRKMINCTKSGLPFNSITMEGLESQLSSITPNTLKSIAKEVLRDGHRVITVQRPEK